jgi:uncharacterized protein
MKTMLFVSTILPVLPLALLGPAPAGEPPPRTVSVTGTAVTQTVPDTIVWRLTTYDFGRDLLKAKAESDAKLKAILALRGTLGIGDEDLQTGQVRIEKVFERDRSGNQGEFKHYAINRDVTIRERDLKRFDEFLTKLVTSAQADLNFSFESSRMIDLRKETRLKAIAAAKEKAAALCGALGATLGKVITIEEGGEPWGGSYANRGMENTISIDETALRAADIAGGTFAPGSVEVRISVRTTFAIE